MPSGTELIIKPGRLTVRKVMNTTRRILTSFLTGVVIANPAVEYLDVNPNREKSEKLGDGSVVVRLRRRIFRNRSLFILLQDRFPACACSKAPVRGH